MLLVLILLLLLLQRLKLLLIDGLGGEADWLYQLVALHLTWVLVQALIVKCAENCLS